MFRSRASTFPTRRISSATTSTAAGRSAGVWSAITPPTGAMMRCSPIATSSSAIRMARPRCRSSISAASCSRKSPPRSPPTPAGSRTTRSASSGRSTFRLNATGLKMADGSFRAGDQLLLFNNAQVGINKSPSAIYIQTAAANGPWRMSGDHVNDRGSDIIPAGTGFIIRKATGNGQPDFWTNNFPVQAISAVSRKTHGSAGDFDIPLPLSGTLRGRVPQQRRHLQNHLHLPFRRHLQRRRRHLGHREHRHAFRHLLQCRHRRSGRRD